MKNNTEDLLEGFNEKLTGIYRGVIEDNKTDPWKMGRCKIRIFGIHTPNTVKTPTDGIPTEELPWAEPVMGLFEGSVSGYGSWSVPVQGSHVMVFFEAGHIMKPRYFATVPGIPERQDHNITDYDGFQDPDFEYPEEETVAPHHPHALLESDFHRLARGEIADTIVEDKEAKLDLGVSIALNGTWDEPVPFYLAEYPYNKVVASQSGMILECDDTPGEERLHAYHISNSYVEINKFGDMVMRNAGNRWDITDRNRKSHIWETYDRTVDIDRTSKVKGEEREEIDLDRTSVIHGNENETIDLDKTHLIKGNEYKTVEQNSTTNINIIDTDIIGDDKYVEVGGDYILHVKGKLFISADGGIDMWGGGNINEDAPEIHLNDGIAVQTPIPKDEE